MLNKVEKVYKKIFIILIFVMLINIMLINTNKLYATSSYTQTIKSGIDAFPESYQEALRVLKEQHPNWNFEAYYTGISWDDLVANETDCGHNRIINSASSLWKCECGNVASGYACASDSIIKYYMDPRNFIKNDVLVFQFLEMTYNSSVQNISGVESIIKNTFMNTTVNIDGRGTMSYAQIIMEAAEQSNMSPYSIATKIIQEVGSNGSSSVSGTYAGFEGYYNFFNYGANDEGNAVSNGLQYAKDHGWSNQYIAIVEGAKLLADSYTNAGQNTAYFYKWDVVGSSILKTGQTVTVTSSQLFNHQYMTNVQDPTGQTSRLYNTYLSNGILDASLNFIIPVYNDMPGLNKLPTTLTEADGELYYSVGTGVNVRSGPGTNYSAIGSISIIDEVVAMLEREVATDSTGMKWDRVKLSNGVIGYVASQYLKPCETSDENIDIEEEKAIATANVSVTSGLLRVRAEASSSAVRLTAIENGEQVEILQKDVKTDENYTWYKIRYNGIVGYVASQYLTNIVDIDDNGGENGDNNPDKPETSGEKIKLDGENVITVPDVTVSEVAQFLGTTNYQVTNNDIVIENTQNVGTGYIITNNDTKEKKTIIVMGDINSDTYVDSGDTYLIKLYITELKTIDNDNNKKAADINKDGYIDSGDSYILKKHVMKIENISL